MPCQAATVLPIKFSVVYTQFACEADAPPCCPPASCMQLRQQQQPEGRQLIILQQIAQHEWKQQQLSLCPHCEDQHRLSHFQWRQCML